MKLQIVTSKGIPIMVDDLVVEVLDRLELPILATRGQVKAEITRVLDGIEEETKLKTLTLGPAHR